jgi:ribonuclease VapC
MLDGAHISAVNVAEVASKLAEKGDDEDQLREVIGALGLTVVPFDECHAYRAAALRPLTSTAGLSLGDRACVATAQILGVKAVTADQSWSKLNLAVEVQVIR